jgi:hypothetical protein
VVFERADEKAPRSARAGAGAACRAFAANAEEIYDDQVAEIVFCMRGWGEKDLKTGAVLKTRSRSTERSGPSARRTPTKFVRRFDSALEQVQEGVANRALFTPTSATN